jgi:predicted Holliday junction resolvase-like endonuclease
MNTAIILIIIGFVTYFLWRFSVNYALKAREKVKESEFKLRQQRVLFGKQAEQFMTLMYQYPYDRSGFRFLGSPIDGIQFNENDIVFVEFKTENATLTEKQVRIKNLIEGGNVKWMEIRIPPKN